MIERKEGTQETVKAETLLAELRERTSTVIINNAARHIQDGQTIKAQQETINELKEGLRLRDSRIAELETKIETLESKLLTANNYIAALKASVKNPLGE